MYRSISITPLCAPSAEALADQIALVESLFDSDPLLSRWVLFWGPPGASRQQVESFLRLLPDGVVVMGASAQDAINVKGHVQAAWSAVCFSSRFMTVHIGWGELEELSGEEDIGACTRHFRDSFPKGYFESRERLGAHGVKYERPTFLLLFLPGVCGEQEPDWPVGNKDYQILKAVQTEIGGDIQIFGGSAACRWPGPGQTAWSPWIAWRQKSDCSGRWLRRGIVALAVETDLSFGFGFSHGVELEEPTAIARLADDFGEAEAKEAQTVHRTRPPKFHRGRFLDSPGTPVPLIKREVGRCPRMEPLAQNAAWRTLLVLEGPDTFVNPPYEGSEGTVEFLRPLSKGSILYLGQATSKSLVSGAGEAVVEATGSVFMPEGVLLMNCMGRLGLLGESVAEEVSRITGAAGGKPVFGMYVDGEICPAGPHNQAGYRNWTVCALAFGSEFNEQYASAARAHLLNEVDQVISRGGTLDSVLTKVVECTAILHQTDSCHIRVFSLARRCLRLASATGAAARLLRREIDVDDPALRSLIAREAFAKGEVIKVDREEYRRREAFSLYEGNPAEIEEILSGIQWFTAIPIMLDGRCWAVLNINSLDPRYSSNSPRSPSQERWERRVNRLVSELAARLAVPITSARAIDMANRALVQIAHARDFAALSKYLEELGHKLFDPKATLRLYLADNAEKPAVLRCMGSDQEHDITLSLGVAPPFPKLIEAWVFENGREVWSDAVKLGQGLEPGCTYRPLRPEIESKYTLPVPNLSTEQGRLGVMDLEAPSGIINASLCAPHLRLLAHTCSHAVQRLAREAYERHYLRSLLPAPISSALWTSDGLRRLACPERRDVAILVADIRDYTEMSNIVGESKMTAFLVPYYQLLAESVAIFRGTVDKFIGDGVLAIFGLEESRAPGQDGELDEAGRRDAVLAATRAAFRISAEFRKLADQKLSNWRYYHPAILKDYQFEVGVMVHFGKPMVGLFGADMSGKPKDIPGRATYTMIGPDVNLASRLCGKADGGKVFVSSTARQCLLRCAEVSISEQPKEVSGIKGVPYTVEIFEVSAR